MDAELYFVVSGLSAVYVCTDPDEAQRYGADQARATEAACQIYGPIAAPLAFTVEPPADAPRVVEIP